LNTSLIVLFPPLSVSSTVKRLSNIKGHTGNNKVEVIRKICKGRTKDGEWKNNRLISMTGECAHGWLHL